MPQRHPFRLHRTLVALGGTYDEIEFGPILENRLYMITRHAVEDETHSPTGDIRTYVKGHGYEHWENEQDSPGSATLYWDKDPVHLVMGESLVARITGATAGDVLQLYVGGWWEELGGG